MTAVLESLVSLRPESFLDSKVVGVLQVSFSRAGANVHAKLICFQNGQVLAIEAQNDNLSIHKYGDFEISENVAEALGCDFTPFETQWYRRTMSAETNPLIE